LARAARAFTPAVPPAPPAIGAAPHLRSYAAETVLRQSPFLDLTLAYTWLKKLGTRA
jgi:hypothetical protein